MSCEDIQENIIPGKGNSKDKEACLVGLGNSEGQKAVME